MHNNTTRDTRTIRTIITDIIPIFKVKNNKYIYKTKIMRNASIITLKPCLIKIKIVSISDTNNKTFK